MKRCTACGQEKPIECFYKNGTRASARSHCKECDLRNRRERYAQKVGHAPRPWGVGLSKNNKRCADCGKRISLGARARCHQCDAATRSTRNETCRAIGCTNAIGKWGRKGYCNKHYQQHYKRHRSRRYLRRSSYTRRELFTRDGGRCRYCNKLVGKKWHVAHLIALAKGGADTLDNVAVSCPECNLRDGTGRLPVQLHIAP